MKLGIHWVPSFMYRKYYVHLDSLSLEAPFKLGFTFTASFRAISLSDACARVDELWMFWVYVQNNGMVCTYIHS
jgi:hypothetical protein